MSAGSAWAVALALWGGCLLPAWWWPVPLAAAALAAAAAVRGDRRRLGLLVAGAALLGAGLAGGRGALAADAALLRLADTARAADVVAVVVTEPREAEHGAWAVVRVELLDGRAVRERAALRLPRDLPEVGDRVAAHASARPLDDEGFDAHLRRLHAVAELHPVGDVAVVARDGAVWRGTAALRARARAVAAAHLDADRAAVLTGLLTGDVRGQSEAREDQLAAAGLTHLVVVSGRHVGLLLAGVLGAAAALGAGARGRRLVGLGALAGYVLLVRWQPSVLRAGAMATLVLGAGLLGRRADPRHALAMAVLLLLLLDPLLAGHLGFGLSVSATAGVLLLAPVLARRLPGPRPIRLLAAASLGAQVGAAPLLLTLDRGISAASVPANLLAVPLAAAAQVIGLVAVGLGLLWLPAGGLVAALAGPAVGGILRVAEGAAGAPALEPRLLASPVTAALVAVVVLRRRAPRLATASLAAVVVLAALPAVRPGPAVEALTVTAFDVGQGDAVLVEVPGAGGAPARMLVDGGPDEALALRRLRAHGVGVLDAVVVSHPHDDHTAGLPAVLRALPVGALVVGPPGPEPLADAPSAVEVEQVARARGVPVHRLAAGASFTLGTAVVDVLSPPADGSLDHDANERSLVLRVATAEGSLLLTGDVEVAAQTRLLAAPELLDVDILKVPHHGGGTNADGFLQAVGAVDALIGVGADNPYGHPHPDVLAELTGVRVHRTDTDGTVSLAVTAQGVRRRERSGRAPRGRWRGARARARLAPSVRGGRRLRGPAPRRRPLHSRAWRAPRCTCSPARRSCCCGGPPSASSPSSRPRGRSRSTTSAPPT